MFLAFVSEAYYPCGASADFIGVFQTMKDAEAAVDNDTVNSNLEWGEIFDISEQRWWNNCSGKWEEKDGH